MSQAAQLAAGNFYSGVAARREYPKAYALAELHQATPRQFPMHHHERDYLFLVLAGDYREGNGRRTHDFCGMQAGFNPKFVPHAGAAGPRGARMFTVEVAREFVTGCGVTLPSDPVVDEGARDLVWTGLKLFRCFRQRPAATWLSLESLTCEMLGALQPFDLVASDRAPAWLPRVIEQLHAQMNSPCSVFSLAQGAGVHPVHLARVFRRSLGVSPGEYLQRIRADHACDLLLNSSLPLSEVASECGFFDQSHMTRLLRRFAQTTPKALRALNRPQLQASQEAGIRRS